MSRGRSLFGCVPDVLFQIISVGDVLSIPALCALNRMTYHTIKNNEMLVCSMFVRYHQMAPFDPILVFDRATGHPSTLTIQNLQRFVKRQETARKLASRVARSGWGAWWAIKDSELEMDDEADLFRQRVERGVYVVFQMADIVREIEEPGLKRPGICSLLTKASYLRWPTGTSARLPCRTQPGDRRRWYLRDIAHIYAVISRKTREEEIGRKRLAFRKYLNAEREVDFHIALQMLGRLLETIISGHGPDDGNSWRNDSSIMWWFLLRQSAHSLARIFLDLPDTKCCSIEERARADNAVCDYSESLKEYWCAWMGNSELACHHCEAWLRNWSVKPALNDNEGEMYDHRAQQWVRQMRGEGELLLGD